MALSPQQLTELSDLLIEKFDDAGAELDQVCRFNLSAGLYVDYAGRGPFRTVVSQLLTKTEQKGSTIKLFGGVIKFRPYDARIREIVGRIMPDVLAASPGTATQVEAACRGVAAIHTHLGIAGVRDRIMASREDLKRVACDLDLLARYKTLHDTLHMLQMRHLRQVANEVRRLETDPSASETLSEYLDQLRVHTLNARTAAQGLPDTPGEKDVEMAWVVALDSIIEGFWTALSNNDGRAAIGSVYQLKALLRAQPARLDNLLVITARRAPLSRLLDTLQEVAKACAEGNKYPVDLIDGIGAVQRLVPDQLALVAEHTAWQHVASDLWQADESLHRETSESLEEFHYLWQSLGAKVKGIALTNPAADWAKALNEHAARFEKAFPMPATPPVPAPVTTLFNRFLREVMFHFFSVDKTLYSQCGEIIKLGKPLDDLLREVSNARH